MNNQSSIPEDNPGFDPESPDLEDPQVDPQGPAKAPENERDIDADKRVQDDGYPPYKTDE